MSYKYSFKRGKTTFYTPVIGTSDLPPQDVKSRMEWSNTPERLNTFFFGKGVLKLIRVVNGNENQLAPTKRTREKLSREFERNGEEIYLISIMRPISGYSEAALMSVAGRVSQLTGKGLKNDLVYDYPNGVQEIYWKTAFGVINRFCRLSNAGSAPDSFVGLKPYLTGHHGRELTNYPPFEENPGIRTVILHHDHLVFVDERRVKSVNWDDSMFNLDKEGKLFWQKSSPNLKEFVFELNTDPRLTRLGVIFQLRRNRPVGYQIEVNYNGRSFRRLAKIIKAHYTVYADLAKKTKLFSVSPLIQPIFTFYLVPKDTKNAMLIFTPNVYAAGNRVAGGPERTGLLFSRRPDVAPTLNESDKELFGKLLLE